jgi:MSHA biogenesis protein MshQ
MVALFMKKLWQAPLLLHLHLHRLLLLWLLCFGLPVLAETCPQIWTTAVQSASAVPATVSYSPANPSSISSLNTTLAAGDYQLTNGTIANNSVLTASGPTVRIFVNGSLSIGNNSNLNAASGAERLLIIATGSITIGNNATINGFMLAGGSIQVGIGTVITGGLTAKGSAANFGTVNFDTTALSLLQGGVVCGAALECFNDTFQDATLSSFWVTSRSSGSFTPSPVNGRLRLTQSVTNQATAASFQRLFPGAQNLVTVEFDHLAYGGSGADGIAVVFSDATITPQPGSYGGPLGYGTRSNAGIPGFAGGWIGVGLDEFGNYSWEGGTGGPGGQRRQSVVVRGSGVGTTGYRYLAGTCSNGTTNTTGNCLNPRVDNNQNSPHRYRLTIDSRVANQSLVQIERNTGSGFQTLINSFNAIGSTGQAAVPSNFLLSLTGSTGGSTNIHELDNLQICALRSSPVGEQIDHFEFVHSGNALTCNPETVTIKACANPSCSSLITSQVTATLQPTTGWLAGAGISGNIITFSGGSTTARLSKTTAGNVVLGVSASTPSTKPFATTLCSNGSTLSAANCTVNFADAGFILDVPNKLANKIATGIQLRAVKTDGSNQCVPGFASVTRPIKFWYDRVSPSSFPAGPAVPAVEVNGSAISATITSPSTQNLNFNAQGIATMSSNYADAGMLRLNARYDGSSGTSDAGLVMTGADLFVSYPAGLCVQTAQTCPISASDSAYASCALAYKAGQAMPLTISAKAWQADGDTDFCAGNGAIYNFVQANLPLSAQLLAPAGGAAPALTPNSVNYPANAQGNLSSNININNVGVYRISAGSTNLNYEGITVNLQNSQQQALGRIGPASFTLDSAAVTAACSNFSYLDQPLALQYQLSARNLAGQITSNYFGAFAKASLSLQAENQNNGVTLTPRINSLGGSFYSWPSFASGNSGVASKTGYALALNRAANPEAPFADLRFGMQVDDQESAASTAVRSYLSGLDQQVTTSTDCQLLGSCTSKQMGAAQQFRYGRLVVLNALGSEKAALPVQIKTEYYDGAQFVQNTLDQCTDVNPTRLTVAGSPALAVSGNNTLLQNGISGPFDLLIAAPDQETRRTLTYDISTAPWLQYDWTPGDANLLENPQAEALFGGFRGNNRQIYWTEN